MIYVNNLSYRLSRSTPSLSSRTSRDSSTSTSTTCSLSGRAPTDVCKVVKLTKTTSSSTMAPREGGSSWEGRRRTQTQGASRATIRAGRGCGWEMVQVVLKSPSTGPIWDCSVIPKWPSGPNLIPKWPTGPKLANCLVTAIMPATTPLCPQLPWEEVRKIDL